MKDKTPSRILRRLLPLASLLLACCLFASCGIFPGFPDFFGSGTSGDGARRTIPYGNMKYERPDVDAITGQLNQLTEGIKAAASFDEVWKLDGEASAAVSTFYTMYTLSDLRGYHDMNDSYWQEEKNFCTEAMVTVDIALNDLNRAIIEGPYSEDYRAEVGDYMFQSLKNSLLLSSSAVEDLQKERHLLENEYDSMIAAQTEYNSQPFTEIYSRMIELDKQIASTLGFNSPADMYYLSYARDYTPAESLAFCDVVKETFGPITEEVLLVNTPDIALRQNAAMNAIPKILAKVDPELVDSWDFMLANDVYDIDALPGKQSGIAFTTQIHDYDTPFIYSYWEDDFRSGSTIIHEFGHFYDDWLHYNQSVVFCIDIAEVYSQGLELLAYEYLDLLTGNNADYARTQALSDAANALLYQSLLAEFQIRSYELESVDDESLAKLYTELFGEYGLDFWAYPDADGYDHSWYFIPHLFTSPFYTISYSTSICVALQIWAEAEQDWRAGADIYLEMIHADQNQPFTQLVESVGLKAPWEEVAITEIAENFADAFGFQLPQAA